jgi:hypothetical protein
MVWSVTFCSLENLFTKVNLILQLIAFASALCLIDSGLMTDVVGLVGAIAVVGAQYFLNKKERQVVAVS